MLTHSFLWLAVYVYVYTCCVTNSVVLVATYSGECTTSCMCLSSEVVTRSAHTLCQPSPPPSQYSGSCSDKSFDLSLVNSPDGKGRARAVRVCDGCFPVLLALKAARKKSRIDDGPFARLAGGTDDGLTPPTGRRSMGGRSTGRRSIATNRSRRTTPHSASTNAYGSPAEQLGQRSFRDRMQQLRS